MFAAHATCSALRTDEFEYEWLESSRNLWGIPRGDYVEMYVA